MADWRKIAARVSSLLASQEGLTVSLAWGEEKSCVGTRTRLRREDVNSDMGLIEGDYKFSLLCPVAQFEGDFPTPRTTHATCEGVEYRVLALEFDAIRATVRIDLGALTA